MRAFGLATTIAGCAIALASCSKGGVAGGNPIALIKAGEAKACAHPEVIKALHEIITSVRGNEETVIPIRTADIANLEMPAVTIDLITLASVDPTVHRVSCSARSVMIADIGGPSQRYEKEITYVVAPSAQNDDEFIVTSNSSVTADRINIGLVKKFASGYQDATANAATKARLEAALQTTGAESQTASPPNAQPASVAAAKPSFDCAKASTTVERLICADASLAEKDQQVSLTYRTWIARVKSGAMIDPIDEIVADQRAWLQRRNVCKTAQCVGQSYDERIDELPTL